MRLRVITAAMLASVTMAGGAFAQSRMYSPEEQKNLQVVMGFWNNAFTARNPDRVKEYVAENFVEHNPAVPGGNADGLVQFMGQIRARIGGPGAAPGQGGGQPPSDIVATTVDGDTVTLLRKQSVPEPTDSTKRYDAYGFEMFKVRNGKIVEHWDAARKQAPPAGGGRQ